MVARLDARHQGAFNGASLMVKSYIHSVDRPALGIQLMTRTEKILRITRRLIILTSLGLLCVISIFGLTLFHGNRFMVSWACFGCGLVGGFVSIQQRVKNFGDETRTPFTFLVSDPPDSGVRRHICFSALFGLSKQDC
jgi:hypothetical protein